MERGGSNNAYQTLALSGNSNFYSRLNYTNTLRMSRTKKPTGVPVSRSKIDLKNSEDNEEDLELLVEDLGM
jgi:hypothetical protein